MLHIEYVRNLNRNYERILLDKEPEESRYQYCILNRCEVKGLLPCSLRYINGQAYLYYDISSRQNVSHLYGSRCITREWMRDFLWSLKQIRTELERFLLSTENILWQPEHIFQDLESNVFSFLYMPYYKDEQGFMKLMEFWIEHIDYEDEELVECIYHMYEHVERNGEIYLQSRIFEDAKCLESGKAQGLICTTAEEADAGQGGRASAGEEAGGGKKHTQEDTINGKKHVREEIANGKKHVREEITNGKKHVKEEIANGKRYVPEETDKSERKAKREKKGVRSIFESRRNRDRKLREDYRQAMCRAMDEGYAVAEENVYEGTKYGQTMYVERVPDEGERLYRLCTREGRLMVSLDRSVLLIGRKSEEVNLTLEDASVSRVHARITDEGGQVYLEDLNSTNGTFRNGLRLQPYEKQRLDEGDEIGFGNVILIFR